MPNMTTFSAGKISRQPPTNVGTIESFNGLNTSAQNSTNGLNFHSLNQEYQIQFNRINRIMMPAGGEGGMNSGKSNPSTNSASISYN